MNYNNKILIVDDEAFVRHAIVHTVPWKKLGFSEVMEAEDGELAYEMATEHRPDLILTDIRMPFMDGLQLAERISKELPNTKLLILTGHDEFDYAKKAINIGVMDYIVKPINKENLTQVMKKASEQIHQDKLARQRDSKLREQLRQSLPLLKEKFFQSLLNDTLNENKIRNRAEYLDIDIDKLSYTASVLLISSSNKSTTRDIEAFELHSISLYNLIKNMCKDKSIIFHDCNNRLLILTFDLSPENTADRLYLHSILEKAINNFSHHDFFISAGVGSTVTGLNEISQSYEDALHALEYRAVYGNGNVYDIDDFGYRTIKPLLPVDAIQKLLTSLRLNLSVENTLDEFIEFLREHKNLTKNNIRIILYEIINGIQKLLLEMQDNETLDISIYNSVPNIDTLTEMKVLLKKYFDTASAVLDIKSQSKTRMIVENAKQYLKENYRNCNLSLTETADSVYVSPSYLSVLFKKETGMTFVNFLTGIRMEKAKHYLSVKHYRSYEIAEKIGYNDPHYFSISFKKYTGKSPSEYRKALNQKDTDEK